MIVRIILFEYINFFTKDGESAIYVNELVGSCRAGHAFNKHNANGIIYFSNSSLLMGW